MSRIFSNLRTTDIPCPGRRPSGGPLASLTNLIDLQLGNTWLGQYLYNQITDVGPLTSLTNLTWLGLFDNQISSVSPLASLTDLRNLQMQMNRISDITPLVMNLGLRDGAKVNLESNFLDLWEGSQDLKDIRALQYRGIDVEHQPIGAAPLQEQTAVIAFSFKSIEEIKSAYFQAQFGAV